MDHVLAAIDGSDNSMRALAFAADLAARYDAELHAVHVSDGETAATEEIFDRAREVLADSDVTAEVELRQTTEMSVRSARAAAKELLAYVADEQVDHVVMGHHGAGRVERAMLGSASETVVRGATVPVTVVP
ncbi:universal stress protein [Halobaculum sp. MBLA0147]|uniref:universal stress protein n=1 Tax=Halobaculum sp. MBLA0147 TaxID=3079934 RepID=UPI003523CFCE